MIYPFLSWESCSSVFAEDPNECVYEYAGDVLNEEESGKQTRIGKFRAYYIDVERSMNERISLSDVLDAHSQETFDYFDDIFGENSPEFSDAVDQLLNSEIFQTNLLILDRLELLPRYRGDLLGLKIMAHMITRFSPGAGVVAIKPYPLQLEDADASDDEWRSKLLLDKFQSEEKLSTEALIDYYGKLGFEVLPETPYMVLSTSKQLADFEET